MNKSTIKSFIIDIIIALVIVAGISFVIKPTIVRGESMDTTLQDGNYLIVNKLSYAGDPPKTGDIIVLESDLEDEKLLVKRVIGVGGDEVKTNGRQTELNGKPLDEPYINRDTEGYGQMQTWEVPEGHVFVMGDNRDVSLDSREPEVGFVPVDDIVGKVALRLFPFNEIGKVQ